MALELKVPPIGESITEVQIGAWLKNEGDSIERGLRLESITPDGIVLRYQDRWFRMPFLDSDS